MLLLTHKQVPTIHHMLIQPCEAKIVKVDKSGHTHTLICSKLLPLSSIHQEAARAYQNARHSRENNENRTLVHSTIHSTQLHNAGYEGKACKRLITQHPMTKKTTREYGHRMNRKLSNLIKHKQLLPPSLKQWTENLVCGVCL